MKRYGPLVAIYTLVFAVLALTGHYPLLRYALARFGLLATIYVGLRWNELTAIVLGLLVGLTAILLEGCAIDLPLMILPVAGWLAGWFRRHVDTTSLPIQLVVLLLLTVGAVVVDLLLHLDQRPSLLALVMPIVGAFFLGLVLYPAADRAFKPPHSASRRGLKIEQQS